MEANRIFNEIQKLPVHDRIKIVEQTLKAIRELEMKQEMENAVNELLPDYQTDNELTAFTSLDLEDFYETR